MNSYVSDADFYPYKTYAVIVAIAYIMETANVGSSFKRKLLGLLKELPQVVSEKEMGFPKNWEHEKFWQL